jgi:hypothetical protein
LFGLGERRFLNRNEGSVIANVAMITGCVLGIAIDRPSSRHHYEVAERKNIGEAKLDYGILILERSASAL